ncbi:MAG: SUMF1/EgtB/PvdO family nonheme iron enzyme, partial [Roseibacillus sp.]
MRILSTLILLGIAPALCDEPKSAEKKPVPEAKTPAAKGPPGPAPKGMVWIPGGNYMRGEARKLQGARTEYPEEQPVHRVTVDGYWLDATEVTNRQFAEFIKATGYQTQAEKGWDPRDFPNAPADQLKGGALCFMPPARKVELWQPGSEWQWWNFIEGGNWRHPKGPGSHIEDKLDHPVV